MQLTNRICPVHTQTNRALATLFRRDYLTPDLVSIAADKVLGHRIHLVEAPPTTSRAQDDDQQETDRRKVTAAKVVAEVIRIVYVPL